MVCLIVNLPAAILPNVSTPNQPLTKRAFIADPTNPPPSLTLQIREEEQ